ncbi:MAG TPA: ring-cleaving dioxygenase [Verrucomicrobia bacterium]|nr:ring-cleaving dioxygenase [Verrucomicrobiota bacterium]HOB31536.1 ring-cleaving dioxygenase [Verrucomicrobiota bacterium]HOP97857.1 ring-cleaving dioxygenase [Verrucomicrobiota bacterium]HPU56166.1 ring-cleaving dioxygenase [Verrucomicrobiota bacterium]
MPIPGLHHVTAIATDPQHNLDFYCGVLGLRLVKRTVNFDDPGTYHFYFGDARGTPGTLLTFFPWAGARRARRGTGQVETTAYAIPPGSIRYWLERLKAHGVSVEHAPARFGEEVIRFADPDGMLLELVATAPPTGVEPWPGAVPAEHALRGFHGVTAALEGYERTAKLLTETFGWRLVNEFGNRFRFAPAGDAAEPGRFVDLVCMPDGQRAGGGAGSVHHIAFRVENDQEQRRWRERIVSLGFDVSPVMDRTYFHSIYFREPGGILFEIATDGPGFLIDEPAASLGESLKVPPWLEAIRERLERVLPPITVPKNAP